MHGHGTPQMAFVSGGHLGQDVALERLAALDGATGTNTKALFRAALGLHFWHLMIPWVVLGRRLQTDLQTFWPRATLIGHRAFAGAVPKFSSHRRSAGDRGLVRHRFGHGLFL